MDYSKVFVEIYTPIHSCKNIYFLELNIFVCRNYEAIVYTIKLYNFMLNIICYATLMLYIVILYVV